MPCTISSTSCNTDMCKILVVSGLNILNIYHVKCIILIYFFLYFFSFVIVLELVYTGDGLDQNVLLKLSAILV